jgi:hypothetical protein
MAGTGGWVEVCAVAVLASTTDSNRFVKYRTPFFLITAGSQLCEQLFSCLYFYLNFLGHFCNICSIRCTLLSILDLATGKRSR